MNEKRIQLEAEIARRKRLMKLDPSDLHKRMIKELESELEVEKRRELM
jgi:hypothetical protein